jgi:hypothetical protein
VSVLLCSTALVGAGCSSSEVTEEQFVDHAIEISKGLKGSENEPLYRTAFSCAYEELKGQQDLLGDFMDITAEEDYPDAMSAAISKPLAPCLTEVARDFATGASGASGSIGTTGVAGTGATGAS